MARYRLYDMHCHLDFMADARAVARDAAAQGLAIFATTVTPHGYLGARELLGDEPNVRVGVGLHPWWVADGRCAAEDVGRAADLARGSRWVGEVGLDFSSAHVPGGSEARQAEAFRLLARACADGASPTGPRLLSVHAVRSAGAVLEILAETGCLEACACVFHWFSGTSDELHRAVRAGCHLSVNELMLATRRGRAYARQVPERLLLTETDLPPREGEAFAASQVAASLERTLEALSALRGPGVREAVAENAAALMGL